MLSFLPHLCIFLVKGIEAWHKNKAQQAGWQGGALLCLSFIVLYERATPIGKESGCASRDDR